MDYNKIFTLEDIKYFCEYDQIWKTEEWKFILNKNSGYLVSDLGRIKSLKYFRRKEEKIMKTCFATKGYKLVCLTIDKVSKTHKVHQLVAIAFLSHTPCGMKLVVNHKNFDKTDNRKNNLEIITNRLNCSIIEKKTSSKYTGVYWHKKNRNWVAGIKENGKRKHIGSFVNELDAHNAYQKALSEIK